MKKTKKNRKKRRKIEKIVKHEIPKKEKLDFLAFTEEKIINRKKVVTPSLEFRITAEDEINIERFSTETTNEALTKANVNYELQNKNQYMENKPETNNPLQNRVYELKERMQETRRVFQIEDFTKRKEEERIIFPVMEMQQYQNYMPYKIRSIKEKEKEEEKQKYRIN